MKVRIQKFFGMNKKGLIFKVWIEKRPESISRSSRAPYQSVRSRHQINIGGTFLFVCLGSRPKINKDSAIIFSIWQSLGEQKKAESQFFLLQFLWKSYLRRDLLKPEFLISVQRILKPNLVRREGGQRELKGCIIISRRNHYPEILFLERLYNYHHLSIPKSLWYIAS